MGHRRGRLIIIMSCLVVTKPAIASSAATTIADASMIKTGAERIEQRAFHRHRAQSFYCYPKNYWWFYRPYTTGLDGHARCMPYFHYLGPGGRRGKADDYIK